MLKILCSSCWQSKEIIFQLQEDLMKLLNELYTVSSASRLHRKKH